MPNLACRCAALSLVLLASTAAVAADSAAATGTTTIYRWVDAQGVVHFSDAPQPGAQQLHIAPAQTYTAPATQAGPAPPEVLSAPVLTYEACTIAQPMPEQSFYAPEAVPVSVQLAPSLRSGDRVSVSVDGKELAPADGSGLNYQVDSPDRGAHTLSLEVRDARGRKVCSAQSVTFYVQRPSLLSPQSPSRARAGTAGSAH